MILISLIGPQILPNIFALRHYGNEISKHFILCDKNPKNLAAAQLLKEFCEPSGVPTIVITANLKQAHSCYNVCCQIIEDNHTVQTILNATCSLKTAALGAFMAMQQHNQRTIYVDGQRIQRVHHSEDHNTIAPIKARISIADYLQAYGFSITPSTQDHTIGEKFGNYLFDDNLLRIWMRDSKYTPHERIAKWLRSNNILAGNRTIKPEKRAWYSGTWFEQWVYVTLKKHFAKNPAVSDICSSFKVKKHAENEIDVAFVHNNILHLIECKAGKPEKQSQEGLRFSSVAETIGGTYTKCAVLFLRPTKDTIKERASDTSNLHYIDNIENTTDLCTKVDQWLEKSNFS